MPKISQTGAFKLWEDGTCNESKAGFGPESLECKKSDKVQGKRLLLPVVSLRQRPKADDRWDVTPVDGANEAKKKAEFAYTCICVTPILPADCTIYDTRSAN